jgi:hypothetical protein
VEFGIILSVLMLLTVGFVDIGRAFYEYNEVSALARYGARWASVVGGTCSLAGNAVNDWCSPSGSATSGTFWNLAGNYPLQSSGSQHFGVPCPSYTSHPEDYYSVLPYIGTKTIVGALAQRWDSNSTTPSTQTGGTGPGLDKSLVSVCIATTNDATDTSQKYPALGDAVTVVVRYPFQAVSGLFGKQLKFELAATSIYRVE